MSSRARFSAITDVKSQIPSCQQKLYEIQSWCAEMGSYLQGVHSKLGQVSESTDNPELDSKCKQFKPYLFRIHNALDQLATAVQQVDHYSALKKLFNQLTSFNSSISVSQGFDSVHDEAPEDDLEMTIVEPERLKAELPPIYSAYNQSTEVRVSFSSLPWSKFKFDDQQQQVLAKSLSCFVSGDSLGAKLNQRPYRVMALHRLSDAPQETSSLIFLEPGKLIGEAGLEIKDASLLKGSLTEFKVVLKNNTANLQRKDASLHIVAAFKNLQHTWLQVLDVHKDTEQKEGDEQGVQNQIKPNLVLVPAIPENGSGASRVIQYLNFGARPLRNSIMKLIQNSKTEQLLLLVLRSKSELVFYDPMTLVPVPNANAASPSRGEPEPFKMSSGDEAIFDFQCMETDESKALLVAVVTTSQRLHIWKVAAGVSMKEEAKLQLDAPFLPNPMLDWSNCQLQFHSSNELALFWTQADDLKVKRIKVDFNSKSTKVDGAHDKVFKINKDGLNNVKKNPRMYVFSFKETNKPGLLFRAHFTGMGISKALLITFGTQISAAEKTLMKSKTDVE